MSVSTRQSVSRSEKTSVVIDLGSLICKCGFAGEACPRKEIRTTDRVRQLFGLVGEGYGETSQQGRRSKDEWLEAVLVLFQDIYFVHLHCKPKERRVLVVLYEQAPSDLKWACAKGLLEYFQVPSVSFGSCTGMALFTSGLTSGMVVDVGHLDARVAVAYDGCFIETSFRSCSVEEQTMQSILNDSPEAENEENLVMAMLESLRACSETVRPVVVQNIIICGGLLLPEELKGDCKLVASIQETVLQSIRAVVDRSVRYSCLKPCINKYAKVSRLGGTPPRQIAWIGGSVAASLGKFPEKSATLKMFSEYPYMFDSSDIRWPELQRRLGRSNEMYGYKLGESPKTSSGSRRVSRGSVAKLDLEEEEEEEEGYVVVRSVVDAPIVNYK
uniref:Actin-related protein 10 n=1 Tax=Mucochytrium quahogii TaxID=96639 RepID=A0A7S2RZB8_9STRA|mmetsp:Transcript_18200/g.29580  ORF Transcript_18200/g.29580 Transcript_18200/m.29580 type:complete len:386 (-) Transcript_18200:1403-2560(-)